MRLQLLGYEMPDSNAKPTSELDLDEKEQIKAELPVNSVKSEGTGWEWRWRWG